MSSSMYMLLFIALMLPSLIATVIHLYKKKPVETYRKEMGKENASRYNQGLSGYQPDLSETPKPAANNKIAEKGIHFKTVADYKGNFQAEHSV